MLNYCFVKTSIVFFFRRLFVTHKNAAFDIITKATIIIILLWTLSFILVVIFDCGSHVAAHWGSPAVQYNCSNIGFTCQEGLAGSDLVLDMILLALPMQKVC